MPATLSFYALEVIVAVPVDVVADGAPATTIEPDSEQCALSFKRRTTGSESTRRSQAVNIRTLSPGRSAPADLKKDANGFDLPIALGLLVASGQVAFDRPGNYAIVGELALTGETRPIKGILAMALQAVSEGRDGLLVPTANAAEAAVVEGLNVYPVGSLAEAVGFLTGQVDMDPEAVDLDDLFAQHSHMEEDFVDVKGQDYAKRALLIAAAGSHNVLMIGPPGTGKTLLAKRLPTILPPLTPAESLETSRIYSVMGLLKPGQALMAVRPFRPPHHSVSDAGLVGGGSPPQPGEISLAHKGVLFLDEMPEFNRKTLEVLRQPLEEGKVTISRALRSSTFPADFILVAAMNPCPCGYRSDPRRACSCTPPQVEKYLSRISGPLLAEMPPGPPSADFRAQVLEARARQTRRFGHKGPLVNGRMTPRQLRKLCQLKPEAMSILKAAMEELGLSARAHDKVLRVARTIADLEGSDEIKPQHIAEAVGYRSLDRSVWM